MILNLGRLRKKRQRQDTQCIYLYRCINEAYFSSWAAVTMDVAHPGHAPDKLHI